MNCADKHCRRSRGRLLLGVVGPVLLTAVTLAGAQEAEPRSLYESGQFARAAMVFEGQVSRDP